MEEVTTHIRGGGGETAHQRAPLEYFFNRFKTSKTSQANREGDRATRLLLQEHLRNNFF